MNYFIIPLLIALILVTCSAEPGGWETWRDYYQSRYPSKSILLEDKEPAVRMYYKEGSEETTLMRTHYRIPTTGNGKKNMGKYTGRTVFVVSDKDWKNVLMAVPLSIWAGDENCNRIFEDQDPEDFQYSSKCAYPLLVYHSEEGAGLTDNHDLDSLLLFLDQYGTSTIIHVGSPDKRILEYLYDPLTVLSGWKEESVDKNTLTTLYIKDILPYWSSYDSFVFVKDDYELALLAAQYAAYRNLPLVIDGSDLDQALTDSDAYDSKKVICVGGQSPVRGKSCDSTIYDVAELQKNIMSLTASDKALIVNPLDIEDEYCEEFGLSSHKLITKVGYEIANLYCHDSLMAPYLATAKEEIMIPVSLESSYPMGDQGILSSQVYVNFVALDGNRLFSYNEGRKLVRVIDFDDDFKVAQSQESRNIKLPDDLQVVDIAGSDNTLYVLGQRPYTSGGATDIYLLEYRVAGEDAQYQPVKTEFYRKTNDAPTEMELGEDTILILRLNGIISEIDLETLKERREYELTASGSQISGTKTFTLFEGSSVFVADSDDGSIYECILSTEGDSNCVKRGKYPGVTELESRGQLLAVADSDREYIRTFTITSSERDIYPAHQHILSGENLGFRKIDDMKVSFDIFAVVSDRQLVLFDNIEKQRISPISLKPNDLYESIRKEFQSSPFPTTGFPSTYTFMASPKSLQFAMTPVRGVSFSRNSVDYLMSKLLASNGSLTPDHLQTEEGIQRIKDQSVKPYGRIFGATVTDTSSYVMRSVFQKKLHSNLVTRAPKRLFSILVGAQVVTYTWLADYNTWAASKDLGVYYYLDDNAYNPGIKSTGSDPKPLVTKNAYEDASVVLISTHGSPRAVGEVDYVDRGGELSTEDVLKLRLNSPVVISDACSALDYYQLKYADPIIGVAFIRSGAMGFVGAVDPAFAYSYANGFYQNLKALFHDSSLGQMITHPMTGGPAFPGEWEDERRLFYSYRRPAGPDQVNIEKKLTNIRKRYEFAVTILGDPTYKPNF